MGKLEDICGKYVSKREEREKVLEAVERCLKKGYDYENMKERVYSALSDSQKAKKVVTAVCDEYPQLRKRARFEEKDENRSKREKLERDRSRDQNGKSKGREKEKEREKENSKRLRANPEEDQREKEKKERHRLAREVYLNKLKEDEKERTSVVTEEQLRAKELMYKAQQEIEERKRALAVASGALPPVAAIDPEAAGLAPVAKGLALRPQEALMFMNYSMEKKSRVEELKAKLAKSGAASRLGSITGKTGQTAPEIAKKAPQQIQLVKPVPQQEEKTDSIIEYLDPRIGTKPAERRRRGFAFHEKGEFEKLANKQRAMAKLEKLQSEVSSAAQSTGISSAVKLAMVTPSSTARVDSGVPDIEWWDSVVLDKFNYDEIPDLNDAERFSETISELVEHPISLRPPTDPLVPQYLKVYLTSKEQRKIRRQNRKEAQKEKTEKIRLGLEKAPEPKVKIGNLMRVLGNEAIQDPTKMEAHVRKQMAERLKKHEQSNADRKLSDEQKGMKKTKRLAEDTSISVHVSIYRVKSLLHPSKKFKVEMNAKQLQMTGVVMLHKTMNVVVVEGGPKQQKFYKNLMLNRIKWTDEIIGQKKDAEKDAPGERNACELVWEGQVKRRCFRDFTVHTATLEKQAREFFEKHAVAQYWDLCYSTTVLLEGQDILPTC
ncbi:unnamed protein product [Caenorhabditis auriculariae]|uniref:Uncharacterized protein n=1 Tax=Caenorhabditis auriculariae TaxID=2777116 RepID=A0A8S1HKZ3_9PELO|nr:unnamed protein product [Caenorhabditis auriculariae]